jgi:hypothetical protein
VTTTPKNDETADLFGWKNPTAEMRDLEAAARELAGQCGIELASSGEGLLSQIIRLVKNLTPEQIAGLLTIVRSTHYLQKLQCDHVPSYFGCGYSKREVLVLTKGIRRGIAASQRSAA